MNDVNKCYKLKLFLQQFFISAAVLNSELPLNSRTHILDVSVVSFDGCCCCCIVVLLLFFMLLWLVLLVVVPAMSHADLSASPCHF